MKGKIKSKSVVLIISVAVFIVGVSLFYAFSSQEFSITELSELIALRSWMFFGSIISFEVTKICNVPTVFSNNFSGCNWYPNSEEVWACTGMTNMTEITHSIRKMDFNLELFS